MYKGGFHKKKSAKLRAFTSTVTARFNEGLGGLHVSSPMGSEESSPHTWEEWFGQDEFSSLPYTYGTNLQEFGGTQPFQSQEAWWDYLRRLPPPSEGSGDAALDTGQHLGQRSVEQQSEVEDEIPQPGDPPRDTYDTVYESIPDAVLLECFRNNPSFDRMESDGTREV